MPDNVVVICGLAHRGNCDPEIAKYVTGAMVATQPLPLFPQLNHHKHIGEAEVFVQENGDIFVEATVAGDEIAWLRDNPFLALMISAPEEGPREIVKVAVTDCILDPFQLPYRITSFPEHIEWEFSHRYEAVVEVDEPHETQVQLSDDGSVHPVFDMTKSHVELRHRTERQRLAVPDAVARGNGYESWEQAVSLDEADELVNVIRHVMGVL